MSGWEDYYPNTQYIEVKIGPHLMQMKLKKHAQYTLGTLKDGQTCQVD